MGPFKKYVPCIMAFFTPFNFCDNLSILLYDFPCVIHKTSSRNYRIGGKKFFAYMAASAYHVISTEIENHIFKHD